MCPEYLPKHQGDFPVKTINVFEFWSPVCIVTALPRITQISSNLAQIFICVAESIEWFSVSIVQMAHMQDHKKVSNELLSLMHLFCNLSSFLWSYTQNINTMCITFNSKYIFVYLTFKKENTEPTSFFKSIFIIACKKSL